MREYLCGRLSALFRQKPRKNLRRLPLRGNAHNVIVIKSPNDVFSEAIFILRDEYISAAASPKAELLRQAKASAAGYAASVSAGAGVSKVILAILTVLLALETAGIFILLL